MNNVAYSTTISKQYRLRLKKEWFNPLYFILNKILEYPEIRTVLVYGGKSSSKTVSICQLSAKECFKGKSTIAFRKESTTIQTTLKKSYNLAIESIKLDEAFEKLNFMYRCINSAEIVLKGLDDEEKAKGIESYHYLYLDELNHFLYGEYEQFQLSLRGIPGQKIFASWNPVSETSWVKKDLIDKINFIDTTEFGRLPDENSFIKIADDRSTVLIKTTYKDNYWINGSPSGDYGYRDENLIKNYEKLQFINYNSYRVNVLGEWGSVRSGGEFFKSFDEKKHVKPIDLNPNEIIHVSIDENVHPYVTQTIWQLDNDNKQLKQVAEVLCPSPNNNAPKAAQKLIKWLQFHQFDNVIYIHGDPSAGKTGTIDANNSSFYDKYIDELKNAGYIVQNRVARSHPAVALSAAFINAIYETNLYGWEIIIGDKCSTSIEDYYTVKEDGNGKMLKTRIKDKDTGITYEPHGHCSDTKRYVITNLLKYEFEQFCAKDVDGFSIMRVN